MYKSLLHCRKTSLIISDLKHSPNPSCFTYNLTLTVLLISFLSLHQAVWWGLFKIIKEKIKAHSSYFYTLLAQLHVTVRPQHSAATFIPFLCGCQDRKCLKELETALLPAVMQADEDCKCSTTTVWRYRRKENGNNLQAKEGVFTL